MSTEVFQPNDSDHGFFDDVFENEANAPVKQKRLRKTKPVVESMDPTAIKIHYDIDLGHIGYAREALGEFEKGSEQYDEEKELLLDMMLEGVDEEHSAYARHRGEIAKLISSSDKAFAKSVARYQKYQAVRDGMELAHTDTVKTEDDSASLVPRVVERFTGVIAEQKKRIIDRFEGQVDTDSTEEKPGETRRSRLASSLGSVASTVVTASRNRWETRKATLSEERLALPSEKPYRSSGNILSSIQGKLMSPNAIYHNLNARLVNGRIQRAEAIAAMTDEERETHEKKNRRNRTILVVGGAAVALAGTALAIKYGIDHFGNHKSGSTNPSDFPRDGGSIDMDRDNIPDFIDTDGGSGSANSDSAHEATPGHDSHHGSEQFARSELFNGRGGSRSLTRANIAELRDFMADYKVKTSDTHGVWDVSTKYLQSQGVSNPTVFEVDAVKDYILANSSLSSSSVIHSGDTIRLK